MKAIAFFVLVSLAVAQFLIVCLTALVRFSNPTGAPGAIGYVPPEMSIQTYITINRLVALCCVCIGVVVGRSWWQARKQVKPLWFFFTVLALVLFGLVQSQLARDMWMQVG